MTAPLPPTPPSRTRPPLTRFLAPALAFVLVAVLGVALLKPKDDTSSAGDPLLNKPAPALNLPTLDGGTLDLAQLKGRPVLLNFWASWCGPCREEAPLLRSLSEKQGPSGLAVVGVLSNDKDTKRIRAFVSEYGLAYPNLQDNQLRATIDYGLRGVPESFFIDKDGTVKALIRGGLTQERLTEGLNSVGVRF